MNKTEIIAAVVERANIRKDVAATVIETALEIIKESLAEGNTVRITNFATFDVKHQKAREAKNPKTGELVRVPPRRKISVKAGKDLVAAVNR